MVKHGEHGDDLGVQFKGSMGKQSWIVKVDGKGRRMRPCIFNLELYYVIIPLRSVPAPVWSTVWSAPLCVVIMMMMMMKILTLKNNVILRTLAHQ